MIEKIEWRQIPTNQEAYTDTSIATVAGGVLVRTTIYDTDLEGTTTMAGVAMCFVPAISEKEGNRADFKAWLESERRRESERFNTVTNDQPAIDVADPDAM